MSESSLLVHEREQDDSDIERCAKRSKFDNSKILEPDLTSQNQNILPPSHVLLGIPFPIAKESSTLNFLEKDVGISEYIGRGEPTVAGIIKQRFTDFLVFEVDLDGNVIHLKDLGRPESLTREKVKAPISISQETAAIQKSESDNHNDAAQISSDGLDSKVTQLKPSTKENPWPEHFNTALSQFLDDHSIIELKKMYLEGPEKPRVSDSGWSGRDRSAAEEQALPSRDASTLGSEKEVENVKNGRPERHSRRDDGKRNVRDDRVIRSRPFTSKDTRTAFHNIIRELFGGKLDTVTDISSANAEGGSSINIKWATRRGRGRNGREERPGGSDTGARGNFPPFIHFTLQKTNRDTQDALGQLSRTLHVSLKDLSVAGTKDKRGVTVQRVCLYRNKKTVQEIWSLTNGLGRRTIEEVMSERGERGIRIADLCYRKSGLELGMLKGNEFIITLRNVKVSSKEDLDQAMNTMRLKGFINYYGMQRFGTAAVPTHSIGLALLKSEWQKAIDLILQKRRGEHPDVETARDAWLLEQDLDKALSLFPRRFVAERCILESFKKQKGDTRNAMGTLSTIPRNLRLMYIHAYQSYVWNAIVSERIRTYGSDRPVVGDLVFDSRKVEEAKSIDLDDSFAAGDDQEASDNPRKFKKPYSAPRVRTLTEEDLQNYSIFDVIMPLPGTDVAYPGGELGERYREFLRVDGLDPDNFARKQREYTLNGSYRAILHLPKNVSWTLLRYTDPDVPLAQSDEDNLLGFEPPILSESGKFFALQIKLTLGTASYATMALREITKTDTSSHVQTNLTATAEDQKYRGSVEDILLA